MVVWIFVLSYKAFDLLHFVVQYNWQHLASVLKTSEWQSVYCIIDLCSISWAFISLDQIG